MGKIDFNSVKTLSKQITTDFVLDHVRSEDIFKFYFSDFALNKVFPSPFREDRNPSFGFFVYKDSIYAKDFATGDSWDCFAFVSALYGLDFVTTVKKIAQDFNLVDKFDTPLSSLEVISKLDRTKVEKREIIIEPKFEDFNKETLDYWLKNYDIKKEELIREMCFSYDYFYLKDKLNPAFKRLNRATEVIRTGFQVVHDVNVYHKLYQPYAKELPLKWKSSVPINIPFGLDSLPHHSDTLIIAKAQKDRMIWKKFHTDVVATQNESLRACELIKDLPYKRKILMYDNDEAGIKAAQLIVEKLGFESVTTGTSEKDLGEYTEVYGINSTNDLCQKLLNT